MLKKIIIIAISGVVLIGVVALAKYGIDAMRYEKLMSKLVVSDVDLQKVNDGTYNGYFNGYLVAANVDVTVKDHKITDIKLVKHKYERGKQAEAVVGKVLSAQTLKVDVVSGATNSSKTILKAIENALTGEKQ
ncbi:FMN-binding protein [Acetivibrio cellulolyticus]|uniref:FMN-binding protein n=1 Tax=Acetivibrio cellulolyticus TaxID=35830 RepID=UPI0002481B2F|nr:FMN-binding protein [Acetivibrio cellulolyticus]